MVREIVSALNENVNNEHAKRNALRHTKITELVGVDMPKNTSLTN
jgi:hypothetical protein